MDLSLANALGMATVLVAVFTYIGTSRRDRAIRRAELVATFTSEFYRSEDIYRLFADIDYDRFEFSEDRTSWLGADPERSVVHMLDLFNSLGLNWYRRVISTKDIQGTTIGYAMLRAFESAEMRKYLEFVHGHDQEHLGTGVPFEFFQILAGRLQVASSSTRAQNLDRPALVRVPATPEGLRERLRRGIDRRI
jgi:hypothetical protein